MQFHQGLLLPNPPPDSQLKQFRDSPSSSNILDYLRQAVSDPRSSELIIPQTTYTRYRQFALNGNRTGYEEHYFEKRSMLTRAVIEMILGDEGWVDIIHDLLWSICEETSWVLPAHEDIEPGFETPDTLHSWPVGTNTSLTRAPDSIDLFAAETSASLAETIYFLGDRLAPEVVQRVRQEVERHVFHPYLAYGRKHWWHKGDLNWNGVCNGAVGLAFMRMEMDHRRLAEALSLVLEGFEAYLATGFEADGGSLEGISYWNYGLIYYVALAELLRERTGGQIDLLASPHIQDIARYPLAVALAPGKYFNFADAVERVPLQPGIMQRLGERSGVSELQGLLAPYEMGEWRSFSASKLAIALRDLAWWDGQFHPFPAASREDAYLPACAIIKLNAQTVDGQPVILAAKAGFNTGHHYHTDIGHFIVNVGGENLLCDPGRGLYSKGYFREERFQNIFCNSFGHSVPRIGGQLQMPGPKFGNGRLAQGQIISHGSTGTKKYVVIDFHPVYDLPQLSLARRKLEMDAKTGAIHLEDNYEFSERPLEIEEAFVTWCSVSVDGTTAKVTGVENELSMVIVEPAGASFTAELLTEECQANLRDGVLTRLSVRIPEKAQRFVLQMTAHHKAKDKTSCPSNQS